MTVPRRPWLVQPIRRPRPTCHRCGSVLLPWTRSELICPCCTYFSVVAPFDAAAAAPEAPWTDGGPYAREGDQP